MGRDIKQYREWRGEREKERWANKGETGKERVKNEEGWAVEERGG